MSERHALLGAVILATGDKRAAVAQYQAAVAAQPALYEAQLKLGELLLTQGEKAAAREHLQKAAQSPNAAIRGAAIKLLQQTQKNLWTWTPETRCSVSIASVN